ncbi:hypothetical protein ACI797_17745 [Geodermatophilus sp. SYSU D00691]
MTFEADVDDVDVQTEVLGFIARAQLPDNVDVSQVAVDQVASQTASDLTASVQLQTFMAAPWQRVEDRVPSLTVEPMWAAVAVSQPPLG